MLGTIVNVVSVVIGAFIGLLFKKVIPERMADTLMKGLGLCTLLLGINGLLAGENSLIWIISIVIGTLIGEGIDLEKRVAKLGQWLENRFKTAKKSTTSVAEGFVAASILFCVGAMAIVGSLQSGLTGNHEVLYNKSMIDAVAALILSSTLGVGVVFSAGFVFLYQGSITLLAQWAAPYLNDAAVNEMTCVGSIIIVGLAFNMLGITKLRIMNYVPAIFIPIILCRFM